MKRYIVFSFCIFALLVFCFGCRNSQEIKNQEIETISPVSPSPLPEQTATFRDGPVFEMDKEGKLIITEESIREAEERWGYFLGPMFPDYNQTPTPTTTPVSPEELAEWERREAALQAEADRKLPGEQDFREQRDRVVEEYRIIRSLPYLERADFTVNYGAEVGQNDFIIFVEIEVFPEDPETAVDPETELSNEEKKELQDPFWVWFTETCEQNGEEPSKYENLIRFSYRYK